MKYRPPLGLSRPLDRIFTVKIDVSDNCSLPGPLSASSRDGSGEQQQEGIHRRSASIHRQDFGGSGRLRNTQCGGRGARRQCCLPPASPQPLRVRAAGGRARWRRPGVPPPPTHWPSAGTPWLGPCSCQPIACSSVSEIEPAVSTPAEVGVLELNLGLTVTGMF